MPTQTPDAATLARVAIMTYSDDRIIKSPGHEQEADRTIELFDLLEMFADRYKVHNVEIQHDDFSSCLSQIPEARPPWNPRRPDER